MEKVFDYCIFGGGVVGASIFCKLTRLGQKCLLIEKANDVATGASKANSGLVHAGFDCEKNTLKAKFNVRGAYLMPKLAKELSIHYREVGAVVVGNDLEKLNALLERGIYNGVKGLKIIEDNELHTLVPNLSPNIKYALYAKTAGLISPYLLTIALAEESVINGGQIVFNYKATKIDYDNYFTISNGKTNYFANHIINCAGAGYNEIASLLKVEEYPLVFKRGEYYVLDKTASNFVGLSVFPLPTEKGKGILATPTLHGNILLGPTSEQSNEETLISASGLAEIKRCLNEEFVAPPFNLAIREYSGIRVSCGNDFIVEKSKTNEKVINICGINSPGLTSAPAIAEYVATNLLGLDSKEINYIKRKPYGEIFSRLSKNEINELIINNKHYGKIICRCERVSEGEIIDAINSPLKPTSIDAIKRRVRAGMGRCQGGFCALKVAEILSKELKLPLSQVVKENFDSQIGFAEIKQTEFFAKKAGKNEI